MRVRFLRIAFVFACAVSLALPLKAQSTNGTINGRVLDPSNKAIGGADILLINDATGVQYSGKTNEDGIYVVPSLPPGAYRLQVSKRGFKTLIKPDIVLDMQDALSINFTLPVGAVFEIVTVEAGASMINTTDASVSTVIDHTYVENMPLNGRSFQDLILLTPGVLTTSPQTQASLGNNGEFSVNGQRTESNMYSVDGVSANVGVQAGFAESPSASGSLPASTALGTTQGLVSVDALQEFRVQSSTYSAEFGRNPGGQFAFETKSGTNQWHGTADDYVRNDIVDANDWFNNFFNVKRPPLRQNDFGGTFGGPMRIPSLYDGKDRTFIFFSYEGLRVVQPQAASVNYVPDIALRQSAPAPVQSVINAFPLPTAGAPDLGNGLAEFIAGWSNPSEIDALSARLDHNVNDQLRVFFRFSNTRSRADVKGTGDFFTPSTVLSNAFTMRTYTFGASGSITDRIVNEFRLNYSSNESTSSYKLTNFGNATAIDLAQLQGLDLQANPAYTFVVLLNFPGFVPGLLQGNLEGIQRQWNFVDSVSISSGPHHFKVGVDYRKLTPIYKPYSPYISYQFDSASALETNSLDSGNSYAQTFSPADPIYQNFSAFAQDEWRLSSRLNVSMGLRWDVNPSPGAEKAGNLPYTFQGATFSTLKLAPEGTPLWKTAWYNVAPRLGAAYILRNLSGWETVLRGGAGVFFDTGQQIGSYSYFGPGFSAFQSFGSITTPASFPVPSSEVTPKIINPPLPPYGCCPYVFPSHFQSPFTLQWNVALEQAFGRLQTITVSYVGANARRLVQLHQLNLSAINPDLGTVTYITNGLTSDYNGLQVQLRRRMNHNLQALASYTWSHSIDYGSRDLALPYVRGNSDFDVRHNLSTALMYDIPSAFENRFARRILSRWGLDDRFTARTGFPVTLNGFQSFDPASRLEFNAGLDLVPGQSVYIYGSQCVGVYGTQCPGGRAINPNAFTNPPLDSTTGNPTRLGNAPRNFVDGFGDWQMDLAARREFPIHDRLKLQFRAEAFNVFNHPNFGTVNSNYCSPSLGPGCTFGQITATLASSLGILSPLYQMGGPRSMQFAIKLSF